MDSNAGFCERCGRRYGLHPPEPDARDLALRGVRSTFRYCSACGQFVGRSCCWNPEAVACTVCEPGVSIGPAPRISAAAARRRRERAARVALAELTAAIDGLRRVAHVAGPGLLPPGRGARRVWEEAWWATGWLAIRAESSRDAILKHVWNPVVRRGGDGKGNAAGARNGAIAALTGEFERTLAEYQALLDTVSGALLDEGHQIALRARRQPEESGIAPRAWRRRLPPVAAPLVVAVAVLGASLASVVGLLGGEDTPAGAALATPDGRGGVLGGGPTTAPTSAPAATPAPAASGTRAATVSIAVDLAFDEMRMGALEVGGAIAEVVGRPEIAAYPTPFDRSVRLAGDATHGFCVDAPGVVAEAAVIGLDLYSEGDSSPGTLELSIPDGSGAGLTSRVPLAVMTGLPAEEWYAGTVRWAGDATARIELRSRTNGTVVRSERLATQGVEEAGSVCVALLGAAPDSAVYIDNLTVDQ
jgi:hypothetical protein